MFGHQPSHIEVLARVLKELQFVQDSLKLANTKVFNQHEVMDTIASARADLQKLESNLPLQFGQTYKDYLQKAQGLLAPFLTSRDAATFQQDALQNIKQAIQYVDALVSLDMKARTAA